MDNFRFVIITGMSGAGKTNFMQKLEDMGYYCVDNLPPILIARFADLCWKSTSNTRHVAVVTDIRGGSFFDALPQALKELENAASRMRWYSSKLRMKRLCAATWKRAGSIRLPRRCVSRTASSRKGNSGGRPRAGRYHHRYDDDEDGRSEGTSEQPLRHRQSQEGNADYCFSFGFKYGIPIDADTVLDVRFLPNPFYVEKYKYWTGRVKEVGDYISAAPVTGEFLTKLYDFMDFMVEQFKESGKTQFTIAVGCTGGMHRSVFVTEKLGNHLKEKYGHVNIEHRDLHRNHVEHDAVDEQEG